MNPIENKLIKNGKVDKLFGWKLSHVVFRTVS